MPDIYSSLLTKPMLGSVESEQLSLLTLFHDFSLHSLALQYVSCCHLCYYFKFTHWSLALQAVSGCCFKYSFKAVD
jgi:hypothetical protein